MRLSKEGMPMLSPAQMGRLPFMVPENEETARAIWMWAASTPPDEVPARFLDSRYIGKLRDAQGWD